MRYLFALAAAALLLASCSDQEEELPGEAAQTVPPSAVASSLEPAATGVWVAPSGTPVAKPGWTTVGFLNVVVSAPDGMLASPLTGYSSSPVDFDTRPVIVIEPRSGSGGRIVINAETGSIIHQTGSEQDRAALQPALDTVRFSPLDPKTAPWPYADTAPPGERDSWGNITYLVASPTTGIAVGPGIASGDPGVPGQCNYSVWVGNGRSSMFVNACTGEPFPEGMDIDLRDAVAFERFLKAIEVKS